MKAARKYMTHLSRSNKRKSLDRYIHKMDSGMRVSVSHPAVFLLGWGLVGVGFGARAGFGFSARSGIFSGTRAIFSAPNLFCATHTNYGAPAGDFSGIPQSSAHATGFSAVSSNISGAGALFSARSGFFSGPRVIFSATDFFSATHTNYSAPAGDFSGIPQSSPHATAFSAASSIISGAGALFSAWSGIFSGTRAIFSATDFFSATHTNYSAPAGDFSGIPQSSAHATAFSAVSTIISGAAALFSARTTIFSGTRAIFSARPGARAYAPWWNMDRPFARLCWRFSADSVWPFSSLPVMYSLNPLSDARP